MQSFLGGKVEKGILGIKKQRKCKSWKYKMCIGELKAEKRLKMKIGPAWKGLYMPF